MPLKSSKRKKKTSDDAELFQKFMVEEMKLWAVKDGQLIDLPSPYVPQADIKLRFDEYKKRR